MKHVLSLTLASLAVVSVGWTQQTAAQPSPSRSLVITRVDGGSVVTDLGSNIRVNGNSTLHRRWFVLNDESSPVKLNNAGILTRYKSDRYTGSYNYSASGLAVFEKEARAYRVIFVLFDIFGNRMSSLNATDVKDIAASGTIPLGAEGTWYASENNVSEMYTSVAYVDSVLLADGTIWRADRRAISRKLSEVEIEVSEAGLATEPPKDAPKDGK